MKPYESPEAYYFDEVSDTYQIIFMPDTSAGAFHTMPNFWQHLAGKRTRIGHLLKLEMILPMDAAQIMEGIMEPLEKYQRRTGPDGIFMKFKTRATLLDIETEISHDVTKIDVWEQNPQQKN